jgi:hypothetical protein
MQAEMFSIAISNLIFGFIAGVAASEIVNSARYKQMHTTMQKAIDHMFEKDETIDELSNKLEELQCQYDELYEATETSRRALESVSHLPPPNSPIVREQHYAGDCSPCSCPFETPQTPTPTCESDNMG